MRCEEIKEHLIARVYGELDHEEDARLSAHLSECPACTEELSALDRMRGMLRETLPEVPSAPRVVLLAPRSSRIPLLAVAASLAGIGLLSGLAVAWAWQARGTAEMLAHAATAHAAPAQAIPAANLVSREEMERWFDAKLARILEDRGARPANPTEKASGGSLTKPEVDALLSRMERKLDRDRTADVQYLLGEMAAVEARTGVRLGETQQAIKYLALASDPRITEQ